MTAFFYLRPCFVLYNNQVMHSKASLVVILIAMLLTQSLHGVKWQGTGSGMNSTVIAEIWNGLETKVDTAYNGNFGSKNVFANELSDRLTAQWGNAWNVVITFGSPDRDTILYGYAFNNQWMWYNGVPNTLTEQFSQIFSLIVWKDYNCQDWKNIDNTGIQSPSFTTDQKNAIKAEIDKMTEAGIDNDVWGTAYNMMKNLEENPLFSSGAYSVVFAQDGYCTIRGRVCRVGDGFYYSYIELGFSPINAMYGKGQFYLFQTR